MHLGGYTPTRQWTDVHDRISVRALALSDGQTLAVLLAADSIGILRPMADAVRGQVAAAAGIPVEHVHIAATHSHSTPDVVGLYGSTPDSYREFFVAQSVAAGRAAVEALQPARGRWTQADVPDGVSMNRRQPPGRTDRQCTILQVAAADGAVLATLANLSVHAVCLGPDNQRVSADFVHYFREDVEAACGGLALFVNGTEGNMNPAPQLHAEDRLDRTGGTFAQAESMGRAIAGVVTGAVADAEWHDAVGVAVHSHTCPMPVTNPTFLQAIEAGLLPGDVHDGTTDAVVSLVTIGALRLVLLPCEAFAELGLRIKGWWPGEPVGVVGLCNNLLGYVMPPELYDPMQYEELVSPSPDAWPALESGLRVLTAREASPAS